MRLKIFSKNNLVHDFIIFRSFFVNLLTTSDLTSEKFMLSYFMYCACISLISLFRSTTGYSFSIVFSRTLILTFYALRSVRRKSFQPKRSFSTAKKSCITHAAIYKLDIWGISVCPLFPHLVIYLLFWQHQNVFVKRLHKRQVHLDRETLLEIKLVSKYN